MTLTSIQLIVAIFGLIAIGGVMGRYLRTGGSLFQGAAPTTPIGKIMRQVFILSLIIYVGIFLTDWFFTDANKHLLNDTIVGVLIGAPIGWYGAVLAFYTTETDKTDNGKT